MFSEIGISQALVQSARDDDRFVNTAWTMQLARGVVICLVCVAIAGPVAAVYEHADLRPIIIAIGCGAIVSGLRSTNYISLNRSFQERPRALLDLMTGLVTRGGTIAVALVWPSAWALVLGTQLGAIFDTAVTHRLPGRRNRIMWDPEAARSLMRFGTWIFVGTVIAYLGGQADTLVLGKLVSKHLDALGLVGVYEVSQRIARLPVEATHLFGGSLTFPLLSEVARREPHRLEERLLQVRSAMLPLAVALCLSVVVFSPWFFDILYDDRYAAARWIAPLTQVAVWLAILNNFTSRALLSIGRTRALALSAGVGAVAAVGGGLLGFMMAELPGFILGLAAGDLIRHIVDLTFLKREGISVFKQDIKFTVLFAAAGGISALCNGLAVPGQSILIRWGVGIGVPLLIFLAVAGWAALGMWKIVRRR